MIDLDLGICFVLCSKRQSGVRVAAPQIMQSACLWYIERTGNELLDQVVKSSGILTGGRSMGRAARVRGDPDLAREHAAGATVTLIQVLHHTQLGAIAYEWVRPFVLEWSLAERSRDALRGLHEAVLAMPVDSSNMRTIYDLDVLAAVYGAGGGMVSHSVRAVQHLAHEMQRHSVPLVAATVGERFREAARSVSITDRIREPDYQGFVEMVAVRDAIEHPKEENLYQGVGNRWDEVPLAWMLSERSLQAYDRFERWLKLVAADWDAYLKVTARPAEMRVSERGVRSLDQVKNPPGSK